jgi:anti-sigma factor RsiW
MTDAYTALIDSILDGEILGDEAETARAHIEGCRECSQRMAERRALSRKLRMLPRAAAPDVLRARVRAMVVAPVVAPAPKQGSRGFGAGLAALAAASIVLIALATGVVLRRQSGATADQVLADHLRSLGAGHLIDVQSNDQHNVKPWFNGRVNLSPAVPLLDSAGYGLVGGRVDYVGSTATAVVVYRRRQHVINVLSWQSSGRDEMSAAQVLNGFNLIRSRAHGVEQWIASDLNRLELEDFARRYSASR